MKRLGIFISHTSTERRLAKAFKERLAADFSTVDVFVSSDGTTVQAGRQWLKELSSALKRAKIEIILCSHASVERPWVNFEAGAGWVRGIPVIPVCHSGMTPRQLPVPLNMLEAVEAYRPEGLQKLYHAIAAALGMRTPEVDFVAMAQEIGEAGRVHEHLSRDLEVIENPKILCAASDDYATRLDFDLDVSVLESRFPDQVLRVERSLTSESLHDILTSHTFEMIHLVVAVDSNSGDLLFGPADSPGADKLSVKQWAALLEKSKTRLVVLATCHGLYPGVDLSSVVNIIATKAGITGKQVADWSRRFYGLLAKGYSLFDAFKTTDPDGSLPMRLIRQKDLAFSFSAED